MPAPRRRTGKPGTRNGSTKKPATVVPDTKPSEALEDTKTLPVYDVSDPNGTSERPENRRRFTLIVRGTIPGMDLDLERERILKSVEVALHELSPKWGIYPTGAAYRSDPIATVPDAQDTVTLEVVGSGSSPELSDPSSSDTPQSGPPTSESTSPST